MTAIHLQPSESRLRPASRQGAIDLLGEAEGPWKISGIDPDGVDLIAGDRIARLPFKERVTSASALRAALVALAKEARATS